MDIKEILLKYNGFALKNRKKYIKDPDWIMVDDFLKTIDININKKCHRGDVIMCSWRALDFSCLHGGCCPY